jgi:acyl carrier protein
MIDDEEILAVLRLAALEEADIPKEYIRADGDAASVPGWDSLAHVRIIMNVEARLVVELDMNSTMAAATFGDLVRVIRNALESRGVRGC